MNLEHKSNEFNSIAESRKSKIASILMLIILLVLVCGGTENYNSIVYYTNYYMYQQDTYTGEWLFGLLQGLFRMLGADYNSFVACVLGISLMLAYSTIKKYTGSKAWIVCLLLLIFPTGVAFSALRNAIAMLLFTYGFQYICSGKKKDILKYVIIIIFAAGIHRTAYIYLLLLLKFPYDKRHSIRRWLLNTIYIFIISVVVCLLLFPGLLNPLIPIIKSVLENSSASISKYDVYFRQIGNYGYLLYGGFQTFCIFILVRIKREYYKEHNSNQQNSVALFINTVIFANALFLILLIGYKINSNFFRLFYNMMIVNYIAIFSTYYSIKSYKSKIVCRQLISVFCIVLIMFAVIETAPWFEYNYLPMFTKNWILDLIRVW